MRSLIAHVAERADELSRTYGNVSKSSVGAIQRRLLVLEEQAAAHFFGEPAFDIQDLMRTDGKGHGYISILAADRLMTTPRLYSSFLLWLLSALFEKLPEVGDPAKPKLVFFFDEAHLLFEEAPKALLERIERIARLIRSKGVGVYFVTQNPLDVPDSVSSQLGNRIQHALRAYTPREQRAVKAAAETFRPNPEFNAERVILELGVGEALVSTLEAKGEPSVVQRTLIRPPSSRLGPLTAEERRAVIAASPVKGVYDQTLDRESAHEMLNKGTGTARRMTAMNGVASSACRRCRRDEAESRATHLAHPDATTSPTHFSNRSPARSAAPSRASSNGCCAAATGAEKRGTSHDTSSRNYPVRDRNADDSNRGRPIAAEFARRPVQSRNHRHRHRRGRADARLPDRR